MPDLPTVLITSVVRSAQQGQSHGGAHLVNLATGAHEQVLDWNDGSIDWAGRGGDRGLRGIAFTDDSIFIAASNELFEFDTKFGRRNSYTCPNLSHAHEISLDGQTLWVTSTKFDSVLAFDLGSRQFTSGLHLRAVPMTIKVKGKPRSISGYAASAFDPNEAGVVPGEDRHHINSVTAVDGDVYLSGVRMHHLVRVRKGAAELFAPTPEWTHNARPFRDGLMYNSTGADAVVFAGRDGRERIKLGLPSFDLKSLESFGVPGDHARPGFGRGLCEAPGNVIIAGCSPTTLTAYDLIKKKQLARVQLTNDVRHAVHGLELWPF